MEPTPQVGLSTIDEERFGIRTARAVQVTLDALPSIMDFCRAQNVVLLIARCQAGEIQAAQAMEDAGFLLMDTLVYFTRNLIKTPLPLDTGKVPVRSLQTGEEDSIQRVATDSFRGYFGHYHADTRLDRTKCDEAYSSWARRSCVSRDMTHEVLVACSEDRVVGFATLRLNSAEEGEGVLFAVTPAAQGRGIYRSFMIQGMQWCLRQGATHMVVSTQITNVAVQKVWTRLGFEPGYAYYTFHRWFEQW